MNNSLMTPQQVALQLHVSIETIRRMCRQQALPAIKIGRQWRIREHDLDAYLRRPRPPGAAT